MRDVNSLVEVMSLLSTVITPRRKVLVNNNFEDTLPQNESQRQNTEAKGDVIPNEVEIENRESEEKKET